MFITVEQFVFVNKGGAIVLIIDSASREMLFYGDYYDIEDDEILNAMVDGWELGVENGEPVMVLSVTVDD